VLFVAATLAACAHGRYVTPKPVPPTQVVIHARFVPAFTEAIAWFGETHFPIQKIDSATGTLATRAYQLTGADSALWADCGKEPPALSAPPPPRVFAAVNVKIKDLGDSVSVRASVELTIDYPPGYAPEDTGYSSQTVVCYSTGKWEAGLVKAMQHAAGR
jgi:hypothetical protein